VKSKTEAEYLAWKKEIEDKLPADQRAGWNALTNSDAGVEIFGGYLTEKKLYQELNSVAESRKAVETEKAQIASAMKQFAEDVGQLHAWFNVEKPKNERLEKENSSLKSSLVSAQKQLVELGLLEEGVPMPNSNTRVEADNSFKAELDQLRTRQAYMDVALPKVIGDLATVIQKAQKSGLDYDPAQLVEYSMKNGVDLQNAFEILTAEQRQNKMKADTESALAKAREEGRREALSQLPGPDRMLPSLPPAFQPAAPAVDRRTRVDNAMKAFLEAEHQT
jgi:hypothetical protein